MLAAAKYYKKAILCYPAFAEAYNNLGNINCCQEDLRKGIKSYLKVIKINLEDKLALKNIDLVLTKRKSIELMGEVAGALTKLIEYQP